MSLPKLNTHQFDVQLFSVKDPIKCRPFLVKEEKILLMALESEDRQTMIQAIKQIMTNCLIEGDIDVNKLPVFDMELWFLNLRARSVGEHIELNLKCEQCEKLNDYTLNINDVKVFVPQSHTQKIMLNDEIGVTMKYPTMIDANDNETISKSTERLFSMIIDNIETIFDTENVYDVKLQTKKELEEFIYSLNQKQFNKLVDYFNNLPRLMHKIEFTCQHCNSNQLTVIQGIENFFL